MNLQAIAAALLEMTEEVKTVKRNKSGSINGNAMGAIRSRAADKIMVAGETRNEAWNLVNAHTRNFK